MTKTQTIGKIVLGIRQEGSKHFFDEFDLTLGWAKVVQKNIDRLSHSADLTAVAILYKELCMENTDEKDAKFRRLKRDRDLLFEGLRQISAKRADERIESFRTQFERDYYSPILRDESSQLYSSEGCEGVSCERDW